MLYEIIQQNFANVCTVFLLILFIKTNNNFHRETNRLFLASALCVLLLIIEEAWEVQLAKEDVLSKMRILLSAAGYTLRPITAYFLVMIRHRGTDKWRRMMSVPIVLNTLVSFSALFGKWAFSYTEANEFVRGPLGFIPFVTAGFYVGVLLIQTIRECKKGGMMEAMTISAIVLLTVVATVMESAFHFRTIQSAINGISITFFYLFLHTNQNNRDPLTGALTRRRFYLDADKYRTSLSAVVSLDMNNLKTINDQYGHIEGDKALVTITESIENAITKNTVFYRTGGDEFMLLCYKMTEEQVQKLVRKMQDELEKTEYRCAMGYAMYSYQEALDMACRMADQAMYENKLRMKKPVEM